MLEEGLIKNLKDIWLSRSPSNKVSKDLQYVIDLPVNDSFALAKIGQFFHAAMPPISQRHVKS